MAHILTDSCADLSQTLLDDFGIRSIPLHVLVDGKDYLDSVLTLESLFASVTQTNQFPKTAAPSVLEFSQFFQLMDQQFM